MCSLTEEELFCIYKADLPGEVAEWLKAHAWKACMRATVSRVRIPLSPPDFLIFPIFYKRTPL